MPRKNRLTSKEALEVVTAKITAAGGEISHNTLLQQLEAEGNESAITYLVGWATKTGPLQPKIDTTKPSAERLSYRLRQTGGTE